MRVRQRNIEMAGNSKPSSIFFDRRRRRFSSVLWIFCFWIFVVDDSVKNKIENRKKSILFFDFNTHNNSSIFGPIQKSSYYWSVVSPKIRGPLFQPTRQLQPGQAYPPTPQ
jgi:hypothetical protein